MNHENEQTIPVCTSWFGSWQVTVRRRPLATSELARRYDRLAPDWNRLTQRLGFPRAYQDLFDYFIRKSDLSTTTAPLRVLDCGVGTGDFAHAFAKAWASPIQIHAVDVSNSMISQARQRFKQAGLDARLEHADVCSLPYAPDQFDLVLAAHVLEHLPDPIAALKEISRVLKPGGWLVTSMTRESLLGRYIQLKWRTHRLNTKIAKSWLCHAGLEPGSVDYVSTAPFRLFSLTSIGRKPTL